MRQQIDVDEVILLPQEFYDKYGQWPTPKKFRKDWDPWKIGDLPPRTPMEQAEDDGWASYKLFLDAPPKYNKNGYPNRNYYLAAAESWKILAREKEAEIKEKLKWRKEFKVLEDGSTECSIFYNNMLYEKKFGTGIGDKFEDFEATFSRFVGGGGGKIPVMKITQEVQEVICLYASWCNFHQIFMTKDRFDDLFQEAWKASDRYKNAKPLQRSQMYRELRGEKGFSPAVLSMILKFKKKPFEQVPLTKYDTENIENGFLAINVVWKKFRFGHMVAIRNGYLLDSIYKRVYKWEGEIKGYNEWEFMIAYDLDREGGDKKVVIDLS